MSISSIAMVQAVEAWAKATIPELNTYDHPPEELAKALPLAMAEIATDAQQDQEAQLPGQGQYQQTFLRVWAVDLVLLVDPDPPDTASRTLYGYADAIAGKLRPGVVIDDNVLLSQHYTANYDPPEVQYSDGTVARQLTIRLTVGETIGV